MIWRRRPPAGRAAATGWLHRRPTLPLLTALAASVALLVHLQALVPAGGGATLLGLWPEAGAAPTPDSGLAGLLLLSREPDSAAAASHDDPAARRNGFRSVAGAVMPLAGADRSGRAGDGGAGGPLPPPATAGVDGDVLREPWFARVLALGGAAGPHPEPAAGPDAGAGKAAAPADATTAAGLEAPIGPAGAHAAAPLDCPDSLAGLEDVAADLVSRRARFDEREIALELRATALLEAERRLAQRADELDRLRQELEAASTRLGEADAARLAQLVKVYESMKAKQAAEVFERLPLPLQVAVAAGMREAKMAAVLAAMDPDKAQRLTSELAKARRPAEPAGAGSSPPGG